MIPHNMKIVSESLPSWDLEDDIGAYCFESEKEITDHLTERFANEIAENQDPRNGEEFVNDYTIVNVSRETDEIIERKTITVYYTHYHGDYEEHHTNWGL